MASGKTTIGKHLALELGLDFYDLDIEIEKKSGFTIAETILNKGELFFRKLERQVLEVILVKDNFVLSTGGGTPCYYDNIDLISKNSLSVYLQYSVPELFARLDGNQRNRPLIAHLKGKALQEYIGQHLFERAQFYEKSTLIVRGKGENEIEMSQRIIKLVND